MAYLKNWTYNFFQIFFMGSSWAVVSINNIKTRASREMTPRKNIMRRGGVFAISDYLVFVMLLALKRLERLDLDLTLGATKLADSSMSS